MNGKNIIKRWPYAAVAAVLTAQIVVASFAAAAAKPKDPSGNLDQCANGSTGSPATCTGSAWQNGNLNANQAHYVEGDSAPYRLVLSDVPTTGVNTLILEYDVKHSGKHALDYLTSYDRTETTADPCSGVGTCAGPSLAAIPAPSSAGSPVAGMPTASFNALPASERNISIYNGASAGTGITYLSEGVLTDSISSTRVQIQFTATNSTVVFAWGGHIGSSTDWGTGNAAGGISGSPYHMRFIDIDGKGGNQDRSLSAGAVAPPPPPAPATLTVTKIVVNDDGGTKVVSDFSLFVNSVPVTSGAASTLAAGSYVVSETPDAGYAGTIGGDCDSQGNVTLAAGDNKTCTITNNDIALPPPPPPPPAPATLTVTKVVVNDDGGTKVVSDFALFVNSVPVTSGTPSTLPAGSYVVSETPDAGYNGTIGGDCDGQGNVTLAAGDNKNCTITNDDIAAPPPPPPPPPAPAMLTVTKIVVNDDGGTKVVSDFSLFVNSVPVTSGAPSTLPAGSYIVSETPDAGYAGTIGGDCDSQGNVTLAAGDNKTCTITNDDIALPPPPPPPPAPATLTVTKVVINDNGGTKVVSDFSLFVNSVPVTSGAASTLAAGSYVVSETPDAGYAGTIGGDCDSQGNVSLAAGDNKSCTITNNDIAPPVIPPEETPTPPPGGGGGNPSPALVTVITVVINDDGGTLGVGDFPAALTTTLTQTIPGVGASGVSTVVNPGTFSVAGNTSTTYSLTPSGDCSGTVNYGQNKVCTLTYNDPPAASSPPPAPPAPPTPPPAPPAPTPTVLGATDDAPVPEVLGASTDELPRTGSGILPMLLAGLAAAAATAGRKNKR
ncbi:MAG TPA: hypothetical protein VL426_07460 [Candidatus Binatia bacterium]|nr:hypothetical protein [Candidatus Binatia bacterium]